MTYCRQAGEQALARSAYREAVAAFEQALEAVQHLPESRETLVQAIDLRLELRNALFPLGELRQLFINLQHVAGPCRDFGRRTSSGAGHCLPGRPFCICRRTGPRPRVWPARHGYCYDPGRYWPHGCGAELSGTRLSLPGDYHQAMECYRKNVACLHGALLQERFGLAGLASVRVPPSPCHLSCRVRRLR